MSACESGRWCNLIDATVLFSTADHNKLIKKLKNLLVEQKVGLSVPTGRGSVLTRPDQRADNSCCERDLVMFRVLVSNSVFLFPMVFLWEI